VGSQIQTGLPLFLHRDLTPSPQLVLDKDKKMEFLLGKMREMQVARFQGICMQIHKELEEKKRVNMSAYS